MSLYRRSIANHNELSVTSISRIPSGSGSALKWKEKKYADYQFKSKLNPLSKSTEEKLCIINV